MIRQKVGDFERLVMFKPGFNWLKVDEPRRNYGVGAVRIWFILIGDQGAVQWQIGTDWYPESARRHLAHFNHHKIKQRPDGWDLGYHAKHPLFDGQSSMECDMLPEGKCFYDGSTSNADLLIEGFLNGGDEWIWNRLEAYYGYVFNDKEFPNFEPIVMPHPDDRMKLA